ncbi:MAG: SpoIID/LytB domain-containing protein [Syntrophothermus sp.]
MYRSPLKLIYKNRYFLIPLLAFFFFHCSGKSAVRLARSRISSLKDIQYTRVLLDSKPSEISYTLNTDAAVISDEGEQLLQEAGTKLTFRANKNILSVILKGRNYSAGQFEIRPQAKGEFLKFKERAYRGVFRIKASKSVMLINVLPLEEYLQAVIYPEMGPASKPSDFEALKAFSVCLRNYTYMKIRESRGEFDVYADHRDQVYNGVEGERTFSTKAISETKEMILEYNGALAKTFYFAACGGSTESSDNVFSEKGISYLQGVKDGDDAYCSIAASFRWNEEIPAAELLADLKGANLINNEKYVVSDVKVESRFNSGRVNQLTFYLVDAKGRPQNVSLFGNSLRNIIKSPRTKGLLRSNWFEIDPVMEDGSLSSLKISGKGTGHGVGFCQWGAIGQSRKGKNFQEILYFYFPGTQLSEM